MSGLVERVRLAIVAAIEEQGRLLDEDLSGPVARAATAVVIEACAKIADEHWEANHEVKKSPGWDSACLSIAKEIRFLDEDDQ